MKIKFRHILLGLALTLALPRISALDLPVRRINGTDYYTYTVQRNESLMDVANKLDITRDDILRSNPGAADGVKMGMTIYLPVAEFAEADPSRSGISDTAEGAPLRYKVQRGETLFGIAYRFGVTPDDIVALNPTANAGVKAGQMIYIPAAGASHTPAVVQPAPAALSESEEQPVVYQQREDRLRPVTPPVVMVDYDKNDTVVVDSSGNVIPLAGYGDIDTIAEPSRIAVLLPLMLDESAPGKQARSATEFVRGFLLGAQTMKDDATDVDIMIYDTKASAAEIAAIFRKPEMQDVDVVVAPEDHASLQPVLQAAAPSGAYVFNLFNAQDTSYFDNDRIMQAAIPANLMYEKAAEALMEIYKGYQPVFLIAKGGRAEKLPFTDYLREQFDAAGITPVDLSYEGMLTSADLDNIDRSERYVFIPASGALAEFNTFARALLNLRDEMADPSAVGVFGYPDWTVFRGDSFENLHRLGATIYTRFYNDTTDSATRAFNADFEREFGAEPLDQVPSQAIFGYDTARYLLMNLKDNKGVITPENQPLYRGLQSSYLFMEADENRIDDGAPAGPVNQTLYIVTFLPGRAVSVRVL